MSTQIKYAYKRHNTWVYRRTYPKALQPLLGSALKQSLKTADATQAKARVAELNHCCPNSSTGCGSPSISACSSSG